MTINNNEDKSIKSPGNPVFTQSKAMAQSAGAPGSAGMVGSKRWIAAQTDKIGEITTKSDHKSN